MQNNFLSFINNELTDEDRAIISAPLSKDELQKAINMIAENKTPGNDGLPIEFYSEYWEDIGDDLLAIYIHILQSGNSCLSQKKSNNKSNSKK